MNHKSPCYERVHSGGGGGSSISSTAECRPPVPVTSRTRPMSRSEGIYSWRNSAPPSYFSGHPGAIVIGPSRERPRIRCVSESEGIIVTNTSFLDACQDAHDNRIRQLMTSRNLTPEIVNFKDKTGKVRLSSFVLKIGCRRAKRHKSCRNDCYRRTLGKSWGPAEVLQPTYCPWNLEIYSIHPWYFSASSFLVLRRALCRRSRASFPI